MTSFLSNLLLFDQEEKINHNFNMQKLLKSLILLNLFFIAGQLSHAASLGLDDIEEPIFRLRGDSGTNLNELFINMGGDSSTPEAAITLYVPVKVTASQEAAYYFDTSSDLPDVVSTDGGLYFQDIDTKGYSDEELYVAVKDNSNGSDASFRIVTQIPSSDVEAPFVSFIDLCSTSELNCAGFTDKLATIKDEIELVFFLKPDGTDYPPNEDNIVIPDTVGQALYFKLVMSAASEDIQTKSSLVINATFDGDATGIIEYTGDHGGNGSYISRMALYLVNPSAAVAKTNFREIIEEKGEDGTIKVSRLTNGLNYRAAIAYVDHFGFIGTLVESSDINPKPIEKLLAKNQCYLVTAGFGHDHYVLNYFRHIRDEYLMSFGAGQLFVEFYYGTAPKFVKYILENKALAYTIKLYSLSIYFILQNIVFIIGCITLLSTYTFRREIKTCLTKY